MEIAAVNEYAPVSANGAKTYVLSSSYYSPGAGAKPTPGATKKVKDLVKYFCISNCFSSGWWCCYIKSSINGIINRLLPARRAGQYQRAAWSRSGNETGDLDQLDLKLHP